MPTAARCRSRSGVERGSMIGAQRLGGCRERARHVEQLVAVDRAEGDVVGRGGGKNGGASGRTRGGFGGGRGGFGGGRGGFSNPAQKGSIQAY